MSERLIEAWIDGEGVAVARVVRVPEAHPPAVAAACAGCPRRVVLRGEGVCGVSGAPPWTIGLLGLACPEGQFAAAAREEVTVPLDQLVSAEAHTAAIERIGPRAAHRAWRRRMIAAGKVGAEIRRDPSPAPPPPSGRKELPLGVRRRREHCYPCEQWDADAAGCRMMPDLAMSGCKCTFGQWSDKPESACPAGKWAAEGA